MNKKIMNAYFFKMNKAERNEILDQHRQVYDGYVTTYGQQINQQPLYVQDFANDKVGLVVNNKGIVKPYSNMRINEMRHDGMDTGLFSEEEDDYSYMTPTEEDFSYEDSDFMGDYSEGYVDMEQDEQIYEDDYMDELDEDYMDDVDEDMVEPLQEQVNKTLGMFKRFKRY
jgi:hypothetical protein